MQRIKQAGKRTGMAILASGYTFLIVQFLFRS